MAGTKKPAAAKPAAASSASDEELLAQQAAEELEAKRGGSDDHPEDEAERERVADLPDAADGEHNGSLIDAVLETERGVRLQMLARLYTARHGEGAGIPGDDALLELEEELLTPLPVAEPAAAPELPTAGIDPGILALIAAGQAQTVSILERLGTVIEGQSQATMQSAGLIGSVEDLVAQLDGTVSDGGDGDDPLDEPITFISKGKSLLVIKKARHRHVGADGTQSFTTGIAADFAPAGQFTTRNREMVAYLRARPGMNREYWELGKEPHAAPNPAGIMDKIIEATLAMDDAALEALQVQELASHKRAIVMSAIKTARNRIQGVVVDTTQD